MPNSPKCIEPSAVAKTQKTKEGSTTTPETVNPTVRLWESELHDIPDRDLKSMNTSVYEEKGDKLLNEKRKSS